MKWYAAEIEDDNFEMILANSEEDAIKCILHSLAVANAF